MERAETVYELSGNLLNGGCPNILTSTLGQERRIWECSWVSRGLPPGWAGVRLYCLARGWRA